jgi:Single-strand binding protein family
MTEAGVNFTGNLTDDPELRHTESGIARAMFRVAVSGRREQEASFFTVIVWHDQACTRRSPWPRAAGSWSWADSSSGPGPPRMVAPDPPSKCWPKSWGRVCDWRRRRRPGRHAAPSGSQLDQG